MTAISHIKEDDNMKNIFEIAARCPAAAEAGLVGSDAEMKEFINPTPAPAPAPAPGSAPAPTIVIVKETFVESKMEIVQEFPPDTTSESLFEDKAYVDNIAASTAASLGVDPGSVEIIGFKLKPAPAARRLGGPARQLGEKMVLTVTTKSK